MVFLSEGLSVNCIEWIAGIIDGTSNFSLTKMCQQSRTFDAAQKFTILASIAFGILLQFTKTYIEGISELEILDINYEKNTLTATLSPSMDIMVSSNFERFYLIYMGMMEKDC